MNDPTTPTAKTAKQDGVEEVTPPTETQNAAEAIYKSTPSDTRAMRRMGHTQELVRNYRLMSMLSFVGVAGAAWEFALYQVTPALTDGGLPALVYSNLWVLVAFIPVVLSLAEMASMAPIAGAQYHWVSEFAPERYQKVLSYMTGWTSTLALQAGNATGLFLVGTLIQAIILINVPDYTFPNWHATLLVIGVVIITVSVNIYGATILPHWQTPVFIANILAYFAFLIPAWLNAPMTTSEHVWTKFENSGGYGSVVVAVLVGQLPAITSQSGIDTAAHMAEEVRNASLSVPTVMITIFGINFLLNILTVITVSYHIPDVSVALAEPTAYPGIWVLKQAMSDTWLTVFLTLQCVLILFSNFAYLAAISRDLFAFARDKGLPFSDWIGRVDPKRKIPVNAYLLSGTISALLSLIYIGSPVAFYAIGSILVCSIMQCFFFSISCVFWRRMNPPETLPHAQFSLGWYGAPINAVAIFVVAWSFFWCFWPQTYPVTASGFNWASPVFAATIILALVYYFAKGRRQYHGPVVLIEGRKTRFS